MAWVTLIEAGPVDLVRSRFEDYVKHNPFLSEPDAVVFDWMRIETGDLLRVRVRADVADSVDHGLRE